MRIVLFAALAATLIPVAGPAGVGAGAAAHAMPVFDASNYAQNLLTAARTLQQINQQIQSLQNEAQMLSSMGRDLARIDFPQLDALRRRLGEIDRLMGEARGIDFRLDSLDARIQSLFPDRFEELLGTDSRVARARDQLDTAMGALHRTMSVQSRIASNVQQDAGALVEILAQSQGAEGNLAVSQATNQLLALAAQQQFQIQSLLAAQFRSEAIVQARSGQIEREARAATRRFLGDGRAYTPEPR